jgi:hypothetical protein
MLLQRPNTDSKTTAVAATRCQDLAAGTAPERMVTSSSYRVANLGDAAAATCTDSKTSCRNSSGSSGSVRTKKPWQLAQLMGAVGRDKK